jgi:hypothetical protein
MFKLQKTLDRHSPRQKINDRLLLDPLHFSLPSTFKETRYRFSAWRAQLAEVLAPYFYTFMEPRNRFQRMNSASLYSLAGRYENPIPPRCLAPIDFLKIPARRYDNPIPPWFLAPIDFLKIPAGGPVR